MTKEELEFFIGKLEMLQKSLRETASQATMNAAWCSRVLSDLEAVRDGEFKLPVEPKVSGTIPGMNTTKTIRQKP